MKNIFFNSGNHKPLASFALLILRASFGLMMITHGWPKMLSFFNDPGSFPDPVNLGPALSHGLTAFAEFVCAALIVIGLMTRWAALPLIIAMVVVSFVVHGKEPVGERELSMLYLSAYTVIALLGAGSYSLDRAISGK
jgi:putative oxidoreductase